MINCNKLKYIIVKMFILDYPYEKEYYKKETLNLISKSFDWSENWLYSQHIYLTYQAQKDVIIDKEHYEGFKQYMALIKHTFK